MKYREKLIELIFDTDESAMMRWIENQPLLDQPDIFRELRELVLELSEGDADAEVLLAELDNKLKEYEESILDEKLAEAQLQVALREQEKAMKDIDDATKGIREYVIGCIVNNEPNAAEMRQMAEKIMEMEKDAGIYDADNWREIL